MQRNWKSDLLLVDYPRAFAFLYLTLVAVLVGVYVFWLYPLLTSLERGGPFGFGIWHMYLFVWELVAFILFLWLLLHFKASPEAAENQSSRTFLFERGPLSRHYWLFVLAVSIALLILDYSATRSNDVWSYFPMLVAPLGLYLLRKTFYEFKELSEKYDRLAQTGEIGLIPPNRNSQPSSVGPQERWRNARQFMAFQFDHKHYIYNSLVVIQFALPAASLVYGGPNPNILHPILIGVEYYFIGMATWVSGFGAGAVYWLATRLPIRATHLPQDEYANHTRAALWSILSIAMIPGIGLPAVLRPDLIVGTPSLQSALFYLLAANVIVAAIGIYGIHRGMVRSKEFHLESFVRKLDELERKIAEKATGAHLTEGELQELAQEAQVARVLQEEFESINSTSVWPVRSALAVNGIATAVPILYPLLVYGLNYIGVKA